MRPPQEFLDQISRKLEALNKTDPYKRTPVDTYKIPSFEEQVGQAAMNYLKNKNSQQKIDPDPLFPDRNYW